MIKAVKRWLRVGLYYSGVLGAIHRLRNRDTLTVFMFHRVLPAGSECLERSEREFAFTVDGFGRCLDFIQRHYSPVSLDQVKLALSGQRALPARAGLVTFDDGWRDTLLHALPELRSRNIPAVLFLSTEVHGLDEDRWWQDRLVEALLKPEAGRFLAQELGMQVDSVSSSVLSRLLAAKISELPNPERKILLDKVIAAIPVPRQMLELGDLGKLPPLVTVAGHGHSHGPLTALSDPVHDLQACRAGLLEIEADADSLSFPHGAYDAKVIEATRRVGFKYLFSSDPHLVSFKSEKTASHLIMGRIHIPENEWTCDERGISSPKLATYLFFREAA